MDELYLENIDELITDHNKIVTYKWLSHTLGVHVNQAKQMLYDYVTRKRKENTSAQVHVTYLVTGKCVQDGHPCPAVTRRQAGAMSLLLHQYHKVAVVREEKLEAAKSKLTVVGTVHVYSIQKATLKDSAPLFSTDYDIIKNNLQNCNKFSAIQCPAAVPRSPEEIAQIQRAQSQPDEAVNISKAQTINGHVPPPATKGASQQQKGIMGMFSRPASKSQEAQKDTKTETKETAVPETSSKQSAKSSAINNFFGKASMSKVKESPTSTEPLKEETSPAPQIQLPPPENKEKESEPPKASATNKKSKTKRIEVSDSDEEPEKAMKKKRRRIKKPQPDSSDEEAASPVPPDVRTPSPSPPPPEPVVKMETEPEPQTQPGEKRRKRKRVLKSKTFLDEDGCMVTEKAYVSESCTDSGEEFTTSKPSAKPPTASKPETKAAKKTAAASKGTKQASIMGFFQKK
ncbi:DNA polymerase delta subunit 3 isoform X2 [Dendropsophus ebraccatus]|uniref:DNA polymerase delta subunit 3 isoform X2 n=1 Tax=Dendropsophus ebraccatus TaxID=150705 RepID=UPI003831AF7F